MAQIYWFLGHEQFQPEVLVAHAKLAESAGFDGIMISEHFHPWVEEGSGAGFAFSTLGAIAQATSRLRLLTAVTTPLFRYHPAVVAQAAATIDRLSGGRFELGVGTGENLNEGPLGYTFPGYAERAARMTEALEIMRRLLDGEKLNYEGTYYQTHAAKLYSPPLHHVPIYLAAGGPKSAALAGSHAEGVIASVKDPADTLTKVIEPASASHRPTVVATRWTVMATSDDEAWEALGPWRGLRAPSRAEATDPAVLQREADELPREDILGRYSRAKTVADFYDLYRPLITEVGADIVGIQATSLDQEKLIRSLGASVVPRLKKETRT
jgi:coenzyme F420-dependent glucose-6-phosphate dehydrogenase